MKNEEAVLRMKLSNAKIMGIKKWHGTQLTAPKVLVYRATISEPTPWDVSILLIISLLKVPVFRREIQSECFNILFEESQNYT
jgi:hypothetical protein